MTETTVSSNSERPGSETPSSSERSQVTPIISRTRRGAFNPAVLSTPESPMFTHEDQVRLHKQRTGLEMEVASLTQHLTTLRFESKKVKENIVSQGELTMMKAGVRANLSTSNSTRLNDLISLFTEAARDVAAATATCSTLEQIIAEETRHREQVVDEFAEIADCLSFNGYELRIPQLIQSIAKRTDSVSDLEMSRNEQKLKEARSAMMTIEGARRPSSMEPETALEMARSAESQWRLRSVGTLSLRNEIQRLQRYVAEGESQERKLEASKESESEKLTEFSLRCHQEETDMETRLLEGTTEFNRQIDGLDEELRQLRERVDCSAMSYDKICTEIAQLQMEEREKCEITAKEEEEYDEEPDEEIIDNTELVRQRSILQKEVKDVERKFKESKKAIKRKEAALLGSIKALNARYSTLKGEIRHRTKMASVDDSSSPLKRDIASLIEKIDSSITELRSDLAKE